MRNPRIGNRYPGSDLFLGDCKLTPNGVRLTLTTIACLASINTAVAEQWMELRSDRATVHLDVSRITPSGTNRARAWVRTYLYGGAGEIRWLFEFDCSRGMYRTIESIERMGSKITTHHNDESDPYVGIGSGSAFVRPYFLACVAIGKANPAPPAEPQAAVEFPPPSDDASAWVSFDGGEGEAWAIDIKSMRVNRPYILAWITSTPPNATPLFTLSEYDCNKSLHRPHGVNGRRFDQPGGWSHPTPTLIRAFEPFCRALLEAAPHDKPDKSKPKAPKRPTT